MAATHSSSTSSMGMSTTGRRSYDHLTRQASNLSNYEGYHRDETASVPFKWESQPGTPKHQFRETALPPLITPPPSYYSYTSSTPRSVVKARNNKNSKSNLLQSILPKRTTSRKARRAASPPPPAANSSPSLSFSSSSSSSSYQPWQRSRSVPSTPMRRMRKEKEDEEDLYEYDGAHGSGMCFGNAGFRGSYSSMIKKVMLGDFL